MTKEHRGFIVFAGPSATFEQLSTHETHYHGDSQLDVSSPCSSSSSSSSSSSMYHSHGQDYDTIEDFKQMLVTVGGCSAEEAEEQALIACALRRVTDGSTSTSISHCRAGTT